MSISKINEHFPMREGFESLALQPDTHAFLLFGKRDRENRDIILDGIKEGYVVGEGFKGVISGDFGRGKTHLARNIQFEVDRLQLDVIPLYVKCSEYTSKSPFATLFEQLVMSIDTDRLRKVSHEYEILVSQEKAKPIAEVIADQDVAKAFLNLSNPTNLSAVRSAMRWLGGDVRRAIDKSELAQMGLGPVPNTSIQFGAAMRGLAHIFDVVEGKSLVFLVDEAERFELISHGDTYWSWLASLREMTEIARVGFIFLIGAKSQDEIPGMFQQPEIYTRIGGTNYYDFYNPGFEELWDWSVEFLQTFFQKGPAPDAIKDDVPHGTDAHTHDTILEAIGKDEDLLETYPFTKSALELLVQQCLEDPEANKPRELRKRIEKAAAKATIADRPLIDDDIVEQVKSQA